jgi:hypothetical protein
MLGCTGGTAFELAKPAFGGLAAICGAGTARSASGVGSIGTWLHRSKWRVEACNAFSGGT